jgi:hypothetical protein
MCERIELTCSGIKKSRTFPYLFFEQKNGSGRIVSHPAMNQKITERWKAAPLLHPGCNAWPQSVLI